MKAHRKRKKRHLESPIQVTLSHSKGGKNWARHFSTKKQIGASLVDRGGAPWKVKTRSVEQKKRYRTKSMDLINEI